jgi:MFS family permease
MDDAGVRDARAEVWDAVDLLLAERAGGRSRPAVVAGWLPVAVLSGLIALDHAHGYVLAVLAPEIGAGLGVGVGVVAAVLFVRVVGFLLGAKTASGREGLAVDPVRLSGVAAAGALVWSLAAIGAGLAPALWALVAVTFVYGIASASVPITHARLLGALYGERAPALETHRNAGRFGNVVAAALPGVVLALGGTWRMAFVVAGCVSLPFAGALAALARRWRGNEVHAAPADQFAEGIRRLASVPALRPLLVAMATVAVIEIPMYAYLFTQLQRRWGMGALGRGTLAAALEGISLVISAVMVLRRRRLSRVEPDQLLFGLGGGLIAGALALAGVAVAPSAPVALACLVLTTVVLSPITPLLWLGSLAIVGVARPDKARARREFACVLAAGGAGLSAAGWAASVGGPSAALLLVASLLLVPAALALWTATQLGATVSLEQSRLIRARMRP